MRTSCRLERRKLYAVNWTWRRGNLGQYYAVIRSLATHGQYCHVVTVKTVFTPCCNLNSCLQDQKKVWRTSKIPTSILPQVQFIHYYTTWRGRIGKDWKCNVLICILSVCIIYCIGSTWHYWWGSGSRSRQHSYLHLTPLGSSHRYLHREGVTVARLVPVTSSINTAHGSSPAALHPNMAPVLTFWFWLR